MTLISSPIAFVLYVIGLVIAITVHEFAHAYSADRLGDPTARSQGRVSLNPIRHLDPIGTLLLFIAGFGWGKPTPVDPYNLQSPRRDTALISVAGPISNIIMAILFSLIAKFILPPDLAPLLFPIIIVNISLAIFNLVPIYPLDGAKILAGILPRDLAYEYELIMQRYGTIILLILVFPVFGFAPITALITPIISTIVSLLT